MAQKPHLLGFQAQCSFGEVANCSCAVQEEAEAQGLSQVAMMDPIADLKLNSLDIVDAVRERQALLQVQPTARCARLSKTSLTISEISTSATSLQPDLCLQDPAMSGDLQPSDKRCRNQCP